MKKLLSTIFLFTPLFVFAQQKMSLPIICADAAFIEDILKKHKEEIVFAGKDTFQSMTDLNVNLFLNQKTGTYSIVIVSSNSDVVCVISSGEKGKLIYNN